MRSLLTILGASLALLAAAATAQKQSDGDQASEALKKGIRETSMGPVCWAAIVESALQVGTRCAEGEHLATIAALEEARSALGRKFTESGWTQEDLDGFRRQMGEVDTPTEALCSNEEAVEFFGALARTEPDYITAQTDQMLARPGPPEWGTCL